MKLSLLATASVLLLASNGVVVQAKKNSFRPRPSTFFLTRIARGDADADADKVVHLVNRGGDPAAAAVHLGENEDATASLEVDSPVSQEPALTEKDAPLMNDIDMLTDILGELVNEENPKIHDIYKQFYEYGTQRYVQRERTQKAAFHQNKCTSAAVLECKKCFVLQQLNIVFISFLLCL
jgi:hypothetical protein